MRIQTVGIVGMGALGLMYGDHIQSKIGKEYVSFIMDTARYEKYKDAAYTVNGIPTEFQMIDAKDSKPLDFIIVATKYNGLADALDMMKPAVGEHTIIISVLNGISSEEMIAEKYGDKNLVYCVALGMDAMREGTDLIFSGKGKVQIGVLKKEQKPALEAVKEFLDSVSLIYEEKEDIRHALWGKLIMNVGINQTCTVYEACYREVLESKERFQKLSDAMHEVMAVAEKEGIHFTEDEFKEYIRLMGTLQPEGYPSMRQDAVAKRKSEVELFAGTIIREAAKFGVPVPVNQFYYDKIMEMEAKY
nr:ketopantoate reductase family protein [uncultured Lachnoclostridium sp.]